MTPDTSRSHPGMSVQWCHGELFAPSPAVSSTNDASESGDRRSFPSLDEALHALFDQPAWTTAEQVGDAGAGADPFHLDWPHW